MKFSLAVVSAVVLAPSSIFAFIPSTNNAFAKCTQLASNAPLLKDGIYADDLEAVLDKQLDYKPGKANTEFAKRFGDTAGNSVKTVGENFAEFTKNLGSPINALYRSGISDIVGTTHLIVVNPRFKKDAIWSLGLLSILELILRNYPEKDIALKIKTSLFKCIGLDQEELEMESKKIIDWVQGKSQEDVAAALTGEGDSPIAEIAKDAKADAYWMYSKWFGIGLLRIMEEVGLEMESETCYPIVEEWLSKKMEKPYFTACTDSDQYFRTKTKLEMYETLMKEVEIREKKRMADRLEKKAEAALAKAEKDAKKKVEIDAMEKEANEAMEKKVKEE